MLSNWTEGVVGNALRSGGGGALWSDAWTLDTAQKPAAVLDFVNNQYFDGVSSAAALSSLAQNATRDAGGLICNVGNINVVGAFLTAMKNAGGATVVAELSGGNNTAAYGILSMSSGAPDTPFIMNGTNNSMDMFNGTSLIGQQPMDFTKTSTFAAAWNNANAWTNAAPVGGIISTAAKNFSTVTTAQFGSYAGGSLFPGRIRSIAIYTGKLPDKYLKGMAWVGKWNKPFYGQTGVHFASAQINAVGLAPYFKSNVPWSMVCEHIGPLTSSIKVLFTNVVQAGAPPWYGHECYINATTGKLRTSIFSGWAGLGNSTNLIQVEGSSVVTDNTNWYVLGASYDGSGLASGVKMYVNGVPETLTVTFDNLTGASDTNIGVFEVGGQFGSFTADNIDFFAMSNVARSAAYFASIMTTRTRPAVDTNTLLYYDFREGSGLTTADRSVNGYNGTFTSANVSWL